MWINKLIRENHNKKTINLIHLHFFFLSISNIRRLDTNDPERRREEETRRQRGNMYTKRNEFNRSFTVQVFEQSTGGVSVEEGGHSIRE